MFVTYRFNVFYLSNFFLSDVLSTTSSYMIRKVKKMSLNVIIGTIRSNYLFPGLPEYPAPAMVGANV